MGVITNREIKQKILDALYQRPIWIRHVSGPEYVTRCPFCGDSSDPSHGHFYLSIDLDSDENIAYNCFKCPAGGYLNKDTLKRLEIDDPGLRNDASILFTTGNFGKTKKVMGEKFKYFDYQIPPYSMEDPKIAYIQNRMRYPFTREDLTKLKVVPSILSFLTYNHIHNVTINQNMVMLFDQRYVGFLSYGNSHLLLRDVTNTMKIPWVKYPITEESKENRIFYSIASDMHPFTKDMITINLCEGVFDAAGVAYNVGSRGENILTISVTGKYYEPILRYLIGLGFIGENVKIHIYADNDTTYNTKNKAGDTNLGYYKKIFKDIKYLFKEIRVFYNVKAKDCGVPKEDIFLIDYKL